MGEGEGAAEDLLGVAVVVDVGGVEDGDAALDRARQDALALGGGRSLAEVHAAERDRDGGALHAWRERCGGGGHGARPYHEGEMNKARAGPSGARRGLAEA